MLAEQRHEIYKGMAAAIIVEAQRDTRRAYLWIHQEKKPSTWSRTGSGMKLLRSCETFVMSDWFDVLLDIAYPEISGMATQEKKRMFKRWQLNGYARKYPQKKSGKNAD